MECLRCRYYKSGQYSNSCKLFQMENFRIYTKENPCTEIDENYVFQEDFELFGMIKGQSADDYLNEKKIVE